MNATAIPTRTTPSGLVEVIDSVRTDVAAGYTCYTHREVPVVEVNARWTGSVEETRFTRWAHADGTECGTDNAGGNFPRFPYRPARCSECGTQVEPVVTQEAYGDRSVWPCCGHETWYSIGD